MEIINKTFDAERALYGVRGAVIDSCCFEGSADGESALKETSNIEINNCKFKLRYPMWHVSDFTVENSHFYEPSRASVWYASNGKISNTSVESVKCLRECNNIILENVTAVSPEFGWKCREIKFLDCKITSEYFLFDSRDISAYNLEMHGKYSFQYIENLTIENSKLDTKDAFWHSRNITVKNSIVKGEYLGWYSDGLTLINCKIIGTQPLCYCKNLTLIDCEMIDCDLSFEYSDVTADIKGNITSVKNPKSGIITADSIGDIILEDSVLSNNCEICVRA